MTLVYETESKYQNIKIYKTTQFGNILFLDDDISKYILFLTLKRYGEMSVCPA